MQTIDAIFSNLGGPASVGRIIGKSTEHAASIRRRGSVPVEYWPKIIEAARGLDLAITYETLVAAHTEAKASAEAAA
jgi:hypothetical protein